MAVAKKPVKKTLKKTTTKNTAKAAVKAKTTAKKPAAKKVMAKKPVRKTAAKPQNNQLLNSLKKTFLIGLGAAAKGTDKLKKHVDELVKNGTIPAADGKKLVADLSKNMEAESKKLEKWIDGQVKSGIKSLNLATKDELNALKKELKGSKTASKTAAKTPARAKTTTKKVAMRKPAAKKSMAKKATTQKTVSAKK